MSLISQNQREVWHRGYTTADVVEALLVSYTSSGEKLRIVNTVVTDPRLMPVCLLPWIGWDGCLPPPPSSFVVGGGREEELLVRTCYSFYTYICLTLPCTPTRRHLLHTIPAPLQRPPGPRKKKSRRRRRRRRTRRGGGGRGRISTRISPTKKNTRGGISQETGLSCTCCCGLRIPPSFPFIMY